MRPLLNPTRRTSIPLAAWVVVLANMARGGIALAQAPTVLAPPVATTPAQTLIDRGVTALRSADYDAADSAFKQALSIEPKNTHALHGRGLVALMKNRPGDAIALIEDALRKAPTDLPQRSLIFNLAAVQLKPNPMRAAKLIKDYLSNPAVMLDEDMANALGAALNLADDSARNNAFYNEVRDFYLKYDQRLAAARNDGKQRWGTQWLPASQAAAKWALYRQRAESLADLRTRVGHATVAKDKAYENMRFMQRDMRLYSTAEKRAAEDRYRAAAKTEIALRKQLAKAENQMENTETPPLPTSLDPILDP
jgi:hypothetical protein